jgi:glycopeptide antibiotics resistance protein
MDAKRTRWIAACALIAYSAILIQFIVFKAIPTIHIAHMMFRFSGIRTGPANFIPFKTIGPLFSRHTNHLIAMVNLLGNILPFMPVGFLAPLICRGMTWRTALALAIAVGLSMEVMEVVFRVGIFDVDDILLNALGVMLGYCIFAMFNRRLQPRLTAS